MKKLHRVNDVISPVSGLFSYMDYDFKYISKEQLDILFFTDYGEKMVAPLVERYIKDESISSTDFSELSAIILAYYKVNWDKMLAVLEIEYDPIHNFSDEVTEKIEDTDDKTINSDSSLSQTGSGTHTRTDDLTSTETKNLTESTNGSVEDKFAGFNTSSYKNRNNETQNQTINNTGTDTFVNTGTQANKEERNFTTENNGKEVTSDNYIRNRTLQRKGNIGNITTQQMLTQEIELWKWNFAKQVLENVRDLTTIAVYC